MTEKRTTISVKVATKELIEANREYQRESYDQILKRILTKKKGGL